MKKVLSIGLVCGMLIMALTACQAQPAAQTEAAAPKEANKALTIGYIMGGPEEWQQAEVDGAQFACNKEGYTLTILNSNYEPEKEISNAEDLISKGVDAIVMFTVNSESGQKVAKMCNDAKIPLFLLDGSVAEGEGKAVTMLSCSYYNIGKLVGTYTSEKYPAAKMIYITGLPGAGIVEDYHDGLMKGIEEGNTGVTVVAEQAADWDRAKTMDVLEGIIASGTEFNVAFVNNEDMATGAIQVLEENGLLDKVAVISTGGSDAGLELIKSDKLAMTCSASPALEGVQMIKLVKDYFAGKTIEEKIAVETTPITKAEIDKAITWTPDDNMYNLIFKD